MSYLHVPAAEPFEYRTPIQLFDMHAEIHPQRELFVLYDNTGKRSSYTFKEIQQKSLFLAASFLNLGWKRGERVILMIPNSVEFLVSYKALLRLGVIAVLCPAHAWGNPIEDVSYLLELSKSQGIVLHAFPDEPFNKKLVECLDKLFERKKVVWTEAQNAGAPKSEYSHYDDLLNAGQQMDLNEVFKEQSQVQMEDPAIVMFTSGSTGRPKGVQYVNHFIVNATITGGVYACGVPLTSKDQTAECRIFIDRPFTWAATQSKGIMFGILKGCTVVAIPAMKSIKECDIDFVLGVLQNERCNHALLMAYIVTDITNHPDINKYDLSSLKSVYTTGQPVHHSVITKLMSRLPRQCTLLKLYAQTELWSVAYQVVQDPCYEGLDLIPGSELKIVNEDKKLVPVGQVGEICIRSPFTRAFLGYLQNPEASAKTVSPTGWVHTSDMGFIDEKGKLIISGRCADMIKKASTKIFPVKIERVLLKYPDVKDVIVVGVPDDRLFEEMCACVIPKENSTLKSDSKVFEDWMSQQWPPSETGLELKPKYLLFMKEFPKTGTGKTDRKTIKATAMEKLQLRYLSHYLDE